MTDLDQRIQQAFDDIHVPAEVRHSALASIEAARAEASVGSPEPASRQKTPRFKAVRRAVVALAACLALVAVGLGGFRWYEQPTAYVSIDVNPSIELSVNRFGIVVGAQGINGDGDALLSAVSLTGREYAEALSELTGSEAFASYTQEDSYVEISVTSNDERQAGELQAQSDARLEELPCHGSCHAVDEETRRAAAEAGMGVGRYRAALELIELEPDTTLEECASLTMRQLRDRIASHGENADAGSSGQGAGRGHGGGAGQGGGMHHGRGNGSGRALQSPDATD